MLTMATLGSKRLGSIDRLTMAKLGSKCNY